MDISYAPFLEWFKCYSYRVSPLSGKSTEASTPHVAFFVGMGKNIGPIKNNMDLVFDKVITNVGTAYTVETGRFTAPFSGTYHFTVVIAAQGRQKVKRGYQIGHVGER